MKAQAITDLYSSWYFKISLAKLYLSKGSWNFQGISNITVSIDPLVFKRLLVLIEKAVQYLYPKLGSSWDFLTQYFSQIYRSCSHGVQLLWSGKYGFCWWRRIMDIHQWSACSTSFSQSFKQYDTMCDNQLISRSKR